MEENANKLAHDIQHNVDELLLKDHGQGSTAKAAENALVKDAYNVGYSAWVSGKPEPKSVAKIQADVQNDLTKLEDDGHLPKITLNQGLLIDSEAPPHKGFTTAEVGVNASFPNTKEPVAWYEPERKDPSAPQKPPEAPPHSQL